MKLSPYILLDSDPRSHKRVKLKSVNKDTIPRRVNVKRFDSDLILYLVEFIITLLIVAGGAFLIYNLLKSKTQIGAVKNVGGRVEALAPPVVNILPDTTKTPAKALVEVSPPVTPTIDYKMYIYMHESGNSLTAINPDSKACGLGQAYPCSKLTAACPNWQTDYTCQDNFFSSYAVNRYGGWAQSFATWSAQSWW